MRIFVKLCSSSVMSYEFFSYAGNVILFQIKVNARNIKETTLARSFIKVTAHPSFMQLRDIK